MTTAADVLNQARGWLGTGEQPPGSNHVPGITDPYGDGAWCDMFVSRVMSDAGLPMQEENCGHTITLYQSGDLGMWGVGAQAGAQAFYGSQGRDHTNIVEAVNGDGTMVCIGGNEHDMVRRSVRPVSSAYGFGLRPYQEAPVPAPVPPGGSGHPVLRVTNPYTHGAPVAYFQQVCRDKAGHSALKVDGYYGPKSAAACVDLERFFNLTVDSGIVGPQVWGVVDSLAAA